MLGPEDPYTATSLNNLARLLKAQGDFAGAQTRVSDPRKVARARAS
jgi:hypothetical protein